MIFHTEDKLKSWIPLEDIEDSALEQIRATMQHPKLFKHLAVMPDVHAGVGCTIGSVIPVKDAVIPVAVGVDIGCGVCAFNTGIDIEELTPHFDTLYDSIKRSIPVGFHHHQANNMREYESYTQSNFKIKEQIEEYQEYFPKKEIALQLGTLGGNNHFIEIQKDKWNKAWVMIHSGSRNIGHTIATKYIKIAKDKVDAYAEGQVVPKDMEYLPHHTGDFYDYFKDMEFALEFAKHNRFMMMFNVLHEIDRVCNADFSKRHFNQDIINIHHNYVSFEEHFGEKVFVHRKGATSADSCVRGIIPGSMGSFSYIVEGKANPDSFSSCSHGAGRTMSRTAARGKYHRKSGTYKTEGLLNLQDFENDMKDVYSQSINRDHLDEAPRAYKDINTVMDNQSDLVRIFRKLTPVFNIKG